MSLPLISDVCSSGMFWQAGVLGILRAASWKDHQRQMPESSTPEMSVGLRSKPSQGRRFGVFMEREDISFLSLMQGSWIIGKQLRSSVVTNDDSPSRAPMLFSGVPEAFFFDSTLGPGDGIGREPPPRVNDPECWVPCRTVTHDWLRKRCWRHLGLSESIFGASLAAKRSKNSSPCWLADCISCLNVIPLFPSSLHSSGWICAGIVCSAARRGASGGAGAPGLAKASE